MNDKKIPWGYNRWSGWRPIELTGRRKKVTGGISWPTEYYEVQRRVFGFPFGKYWKDKNLIEFQLPYKEEIYYD